MLEKLHPEINEAIYSAEALSEIYDHPLVTYDAESLAIEAKVISSIGRRLCRVEQ